jgi:hypothetical protein
MYNKNNKIEFKCNFCEQITLLPKWKTINKKFCSYKCSGESIKQNKRKKLICKTCDMPYIVQGYMKDTSKYCSISCFNNRKDKSKKITSKKIKLNCRTCEKSYEVWNYRKNSLFCSRLCKHNYGRFNGSCRRCNCKFYEEKNIVNDNLIRKFYCQDCIKYIPSCHNSGFQLDVYDTFLKIFFDIDIIYNTHIKLEKRIFWPDLILNKKIIIECQGDYYHCNPCFYNKDYYNVKRGMLAEEIWKKDAERENILTYNGYMLYYIWENDWKTNKDYIIKDIKRCIYEI